MSFISYTKQSLLDLVTKSNNKAKELKYYIKCSQKSLVSTNKQTKKIKPKTLRNYHCLNATYSGYYFLCKIIP